MSRTKTMVVGRLVRRPERPERLALVHLNGHVSNWFAFDQEHEEIKELLRRNGMELRDDDSVVRTFAPEEWGACSA
jgi:hypothetical protein